jgi:hypothetical protein
VQGGMMEVDNTENECEGIYVEEMGGEKGGD